MVNFLPKLPKFFTVTDDQQQTDLEGMLLRREAEIGGAVFGPVAAGHDRQFFCLDEHTWIWHEQWKDDKKQLHSITTRYEVRNNGVIKVQDGQTPRYISKDEARNFRNAVILYQQRVDADYQQQLRKL